MELGRWALVGLIVGLTGCQSPCDETKLPAAGPCARAECSMGVAATTSLPAGTACGAGVCDGAGACLVATCTDGFPGAQESDIDCGGVCPRCVDGLRCAAATDCASGVCAQGLCASRCGDSVRQAGEDCDDGNTAASDGCSPTCVVEIGFGCTGAPSTCAPVCGDGLVVGAEACDDAPPAESGDGCSQACTVEPGWTCTGAPSVCTTKCGDGMRTGLEACDDGNTRALDGCSPSCHLEARELEPNDDGVPATGATGIGGNDFDGLGGIAVSNALAQGVLDAAAGDAVRVASIQVPGDEDVFALTNTSGVPKSVRVDAWNGAAGFGPGVACGTSIDLGLNVRSADGSLIADNNDRNGAADRCPGLTTALLAGHTIFLHLVEHGDDQVVPLYGLQVRFTDIVCGDGTLTPGVEECDDGNAIDTDDCSNTCRVLAIDELEPNDTVVLAAASTVQLTTTTRVRGAIGMVGDVDVVRFTLAAPALVRLETFVGTSGDCDATTTTLRLFDAAGAVVVADTLSAGLGGCALLQLPLAAGTWFVQVEESGNDAPIARYFLELALPPQFGSENEPPNSSGVNDTLATASTNLIGTLDGWVSGDHQLVSDVDFFSITVPAGQGVRVEVVEGDRAQATCESLDLDPTLSLFDDAGNLLVTNDDGGRGYCARIDGLRGVSTQESFTMARNTGTTPKVMYLRITRSQSGLIGPAQFIYRLVVTFR